MATISAGRVAQQDDFIKFLSGDKDVRKTIFKELKPLIQTIINRRFFTYNLSPEDREDFITEIHIRLLELGPNDYKSSDGALGTFIFFKMREAMKRFLKSNERLKRTNIKMPNGEKAPPSFLNDEYMIDAIDESNDEDQANRYIDGKIALESAPPIIAEVYKLEIYDGLSCKDATEELGIERTAFYRALKEYRNQYLAVAA